MRVLKFSPAIESSKTTLFMRVCLFLLLLLLSLSLSLFPFLTSSRAAAVTFSTSWPAPQACRQEVELKGR